MGEPIQRAPNEGDKVQTRRAFALGNFDAGDDFQNRLSAARGGSPLPGPVRAFMEPRFGADFSQVRVQPGSDAVRMRHDLHAQAFTHKHDVYYGAGKVPAKDALTAHELTHVMQQTGMVQAQSIDPALPQGQSVGTSSTTSALQRVQDAIAVNNFQVLIAIQHELRKQMLTDPLNPPAEARVGLATARHLTMDRIAAIRDTYETRIEAARTGGSTGTEGTGTVETLETSMDAECTPYLDALFDTQNKPCRD